MVSQETNWKTLLDEAKKARESGSYVDAEKLYRRAIAEAERVFGADSEQISFVLKSVLIELANFFEANGMAEKAEPYYTHARQIINNNVS
ncbi:MAG TPA: tetratricopeptide repeat protein [Drouetiella sp.]|jgi:tetratricopeptide (TPR) repeat protein